MKNMFILCGRRKFFTMFAIPRN
uniref:Uncharacterized protein n=1 Tax=Rhizophora mucronata TaxID=61149 RepID=A0A2P2Q8W6_RHIMU